MTEELKPKDHAEAVALFRAQVLGPVLSRGKLYRGELAQLLGQLAMQQVRPPGSATTRTYGVSTLERWLYAYRASGIEALAPKRRSDRGHAHALSEEQRNLVLDIRRDHPQASAELIVRTLEKDGRVPKDLVKAPTLRRLFREHGLNRASLPTDDAQVRRRWEASAPNVLWHADVCHGPALSVDGRSVPLRIHAILDDRSRYVVAIQACATERESEMLSLFVRAVRLHSLPETLYLDNGPTYSGEALATACGRLGVSLVHAKPYDPQARGKMERLWRTMRQQCLSFLGPMSSLHDVQVRLLAWLDRHYLVAPHSSLMGKSPTQVYETELQNRRDASEAMLHEALTVRGRRRVLRDGTLTVAGCLFEVEHGFLAGRVMTVARSLLDPTEPPWIEHEDERFKLLRADPVANAKRPRSRRPRRGIDAVPFDPPTALLRELLKGADR